MDSLVGIVFSLVTIGVASLFFLRADSVAMFMTGIFFGVDVEAQTTRVLSWALRVIAFLIVASSLITLLFSVLGLFGPA